VRVWSVNRDAFAVCQQNKPIVNAVASLGLVSPGTVTDGCHPIFKKILRPFLVIS